RSFEQMLQKHYYYKGYGILIEEDTLFDFGFHISGCRQSRDFWGFIDESYCLAGAKKFIDEKLLTATSKT
ncbi:hypothetical protein, partial [Plectonema radiosum]|uniref:hypothetical protein n=1 Tax=Plectonema radiosum TaxID=945768 RepID=UPI001D141E51